MSELASPWPTTRRITTADLQAATDRGEKWTMLTSYDALTAGIFERAGVRMLLVGDTSAQTVFGHPSTLPATMDLLIPLVQAVVRGTSTALVVADLPFGSYQEGPGQALASAVRYLKEGGAQAVKLEGGHRVLPQVAAMTAAGIPVVGHLGLTPQSINVLGSYRAQGRGDAGDVLLQDALALEQAGAFAVVLEAVPASLGARVSGALRVPTISVGGGPSCDAQGMVWQDFAGLTTGHTPRFVRRYAQLAEVLADAAGSFVRDVADASYPGAAHSYA
jgi:3-methyl-2-oxobutanoate hydroxymethyltransferase